MIVSINASDVSKITSGQVIVELISVVKELIDNAIDAGSDKIEVSFASHGLVSVEVADNGWGIDSTDFESLCLKHHTSKIQSYDDLSSVLTLGFRGEAMSSLCAVADVKVTTCSSETFPHATTLFYDSAGKLTKQTTLVSGKKGTKVVVSEIFAGMPVRQKNFLKHIKREYTKTLSLVMAYLLAYPHIRFTVFNTHKNKKTLVLASQGGKATLTDILVSIYGSNGGYGLIPLDLCAKDIDARFKLSTYSVPMALSVRICGVVSDCSFGMGRSALDRQYISVNKRPVMHKKLHKIINEVYKSFNTTQWPVYVLDLELDSALIDVNVTPDKRLVMIQCEDVICEVVREELSAFYAKRNNLVPKSQIGVLKIGSTSAVELNAVEEEALDEDPENTTSAATQSRAPPLREVRDEAAFRSLLTSVSPKSEPLEESGTLSVSSPEPEKGFMPLAPSHRAIMRPSRSILAAQVDPLISPTSELEQRGVLGLFVHPDVDESFAEPSYNVERGQAKQNSQLLSRTLQRFTYSQASSLASVTNDYHESSESSQGPLNGRRGSTPDVEAGHEELTVQDTFEDIDPDTDFGGDPTAVTHVLEFRKPAKDHSGVLSVSKAQVTEDAPKSDIAMAASSSRPQSRRSQSLCGLKRSIALFPNGELKKIAQSSGSDRLASLHNISEAMEINKLDFLSMKIVGQFNLGFIIVTHGDRLFIVDQHALDEIYNYERLMQSLVLRAQPLVVPRSLELSPIDEMVILEHQEELRQNGFIVKECQDAPGRRVTLTAVPVLKNVVFDDSDLQELVHKLHDGGATVGLSSRAPVRCTKVDQMIALRACRLSIMIGLALSRHTMATVVGHLAELRRPWNCPHGRPTMRHLADLEGEGFVEDYVL